MKKFSSHLWFGNLFFTGAEIKNLDEKNMYFMQNINPYVFKKFRKLKDNLWPDRFI